MKKIGLFNSDGKELTLSEIIDYFPFTISLEEVNRLEIIESDLGRTYVKYGLENKVSLNFQDEGKTLKIIINSKDNKIEKI